jgi:hypothetical protein
MDKKYTNFFRSEYYFLKETGPNVLSEPILYLKRVKVVGKEESCRIKCIDFSLFLGLNRNSMKKTNHTCYITVGEGGDELNF